ncbi:MAG: response regulator [Phototrophicaceae bacterium]
MKTFYILTPLPKSQLANVSAILPTLQVVSPLLALQWHDSIAIFKDQQQPFIDFEEAEDVLRILIRNASEVFANSVVCTLEIDLTFEEFATRFSMTQSHKPIITTTPSVSYQAELTEGRRAIIIGVDHLQELEAITALLVNDLGMDVYTADTSVEAIPLMEDLQPSVAIVNLEMQDMHGWGFIKKLREITDLRHVCLIVLSDNPQDVVFALKVPRVAAFIYRPLNLSRLREQVYKVVIEPFGCFQPSE